MADSAGKNNMHLHMSAVTLPEKILFATNCVYERIATYFLTKPCGCGCGCSDKKFWKLKLNQLVIKALNSPGLYDLYNDEDIDCMIASTDCVICNDPVPIAPPPPDTCLACDYNIDLSGIVIQECNYTYTFPNPASGTYTIIGIEINGITTAESILVTTLGNLLTGMQTINAGFASVGTGIIRVTGTGIIYGNLTIQMTIGGARVPIVPAVANCVDSLLGFPFYILTYNMNGADVTVNTQMTQLSDVIDFFTALGFTTSDFITYSKAVTCDVWASMVYSQYAPGAKTGVKQTIAFQQTNCNLIQVP